MNPSEEYDHICKLTDSHIIPAILKYKTQGNNPDKTLWYLNTDSQDTVVIGPIDFKREFFEERGYADGAIEELLKLVIKAQRETGIVVTFNYTLPGSNQNYINSVRLGLI